MSKHRVFWTAFIVVAIVMFIALFPNERTPVPPVSIPKPASDPISKEPEQKPDPIAFDLPELIDSIHDPKLLLNYGSKKTSIKDDLKLVNNVLQRFWLLFKDPDILQVGSNEEIIRSLTGNNPEGIRFISPENEFIDEKGRLNDRWGTPLFFHPESLTRIEIRSAGPDQTLFTADDAVFGSASKIPMH